MNTIFRSHTVSWRDNRNKVMMAEINPKGPVTMVVTKAYMGKMVIANKRKTPMDNKAAGIQVARNTGQSSDSAAKY